MLNEPQASEQMKTPPQPPLAGNGNAGKQGNNGGTGNTVPEGGKVYLRYFAWHVFTIVVLGCWLVYSVLPGLLAGTTAGWNISWALFSLVYVLWVSVLLVFAAMGQGQWKYLLPGQISWALALFRQEPKRFLMPLQEEMPQQLAFSQSLSLYLPPRTYSVLSGAQGQQRKATMRLLLAAVWFYSPLMVYTNGLVCLRALVWVVFSLRTVPSGILWGALACLGLAIVVLRLKRFIYVYNRLGKQGLSMPLRLPADDIPGSFTDIARSAAQAPGVSAADASRAYAHMASMQEQSEAEAALERQKAQRITTLLFWCYWLALVGGCTALVLLMAGQLPYPDLGRTGNWFGMIPLFMILYLVGPFALVYLLWQCVLALRWQHAWGYLTPEQAETARYVLQRNPECTVMPAREELDARMEEALLGAEATPRAKRRADYSPPKEVMPGNLEGAKKRKKMFSGLKAVALVYDYMAMLAGVAFLVGMGCMLLASLGAEENALRELHTFGMYGYMGGCFALGTLFYKRL